MSRDISKLSEQISSVLDDIASIVTEQLPDNSQGLITAQRVRNATNSAVQHINEPFLSSLTDKVEIKTVSGFVLNENERSQTLSENTDIIVATESQYDILLIAKLPWNALVHFENHWDNNDKLNLACINDLGNLWDPTDQ